MTANLLKVKGIYEMSYDLSSIVSGETLGSGSRSKTVSAASKITGDWLLKSCRSPINLAESNYLLLANNVQNIKRARLRTTGAEFLRTAYDSMFAASITLEACEDGTFVTLGYDYIQLNFARFNEWENIGIKYFSKHVLDTGRTMYKLCATPDLPIAGHPCRINYDDYNIQTAYVGQNFGLFLDLEIDTAGVYGVVTDEVY